VTADFRDLKVGDRVRLVGEDWGLANGSVVIVERKEGAQAWNDSVEGVGSLTDADGYSYGGPYAIERAEPTLGEQLMQFTEAFHDMAATLAGAAKQLEDQGFTPEQARTIIAGMFGRQAGGLS
jgi:hypothetical protein